MPIDATPSPFLLFEFFRTGEEELCSHACTVRKCPMTKEVEKTENEMTTKVSNNALDSKSRALFDTSVPEIWIRDAARCRSALSESSRYTFRLPYSAICFCNIRSSPHQNYSGTILYVQLLSASPAPSRPERKDVACRKRTRLSWTLSGLDQRTLEPQPTSSKDRKWCCKTGDASFMDPMNQNPLDSSPKASE